MPQSLVVIPARMASARLPGKPLARIAGRPLIAHVVARALEADVGPVLVATDEARVAAAAEAAGARAALTRADHASGSDRVAEAAAACDPARRFERIVNLQGDEPEIEPDAVRAALAALDDPAVDVGTLAAPISDDAERDDPNAVKVVGAAVGPGRLRALYFSRSAIPAGPGPLLRHIGVYAFRRIALERFVSLAPSPLERRERLEQLRALEAGMRVDVALVERAWRGIDTPADLATARARLERSFNA